MKKIKILQFTFALLIFLFLANFLSGQVFAVDADCPDPSDCSTYGDTPGEVVVTPSPGTTPGGLTSAQCTSICLSSGRCKTEAICNGMDNLCTQNGCKGTPINNGTACWCTSTGCHATGCWSGWSGSCPAGAVCQEACPCDCCNGGKCYKVGQGGVTPVITPGVTTGVTPGTSPGITLTPAVGTRSCGRCSTTQNCLYESWSTYDSTCNSVNPIPGTYFSQNIDSCCIGCRSDSDCSSDGTTCTRDICQNAVCVYEPAALDCSDSGQHCEGTTYSSNNGCGTCDGTKPATKGRDGVCGSADGEAFTAVPVTGLCSVGTPSSVTTSGRNLSWSCAGSSGSCGGTYGDNAICSAVINQPPIYIDINVENENGVIVPSDNLGVGRSGNHICQEEFTDRIVKLVVHYDDPDGISDVESIKLKLNNVIYDPVSSGVGNTAIFNIQYDGASPAFMDRILVNITDSYGLTTDWTDTMHDFKNWDCMVPVVGTAFDGSSGEVCSASAPYTKKIDSGINYNLTYIFGKLQPRNMTVSSPDYQSDSNNHLVWGSSYILTLGNFPGSEPTQLRVVDVPKGTVNCTGVEVELNSNIVWPYSNNPSVRIDFASVMDQLPWFQTVGGGVISKTSIVDSVPITCAQDSDGICKAAVTKGNDTLSLVNGVVASSTIKSNSGCGSECKYGIPNDWYANTNLLQESYTYDYFYNEYRVKLGLGATLPGGSSIGAITSAGIGGTGLVFVNGDLNVDGDTTISDQFLMVVVKGNINIDQNVTKLDGVFVGTNIYATGLNDTPLTINGVLYATGNVDFGRGFTTKSLNNKQSAVVVNYRPDLVFTMPGKLVQVISGWKSGI
jgi:hypothetical protein